MATLIVSIAVLLSTAACAGAPGSGSTATGSPAASTAGSTAPTVEPITAIVVLADGVRFQAGATVRETVAYDAPADVALAAIADALGAQSGSEEHEATNHSAASTEYRFGDGVAVFEPHYGAGVTTDATIRPVWWIAVETAEVGNVRISAEGGVAVGSSVDAIAGWNDPDRMGTSTTSAGTQAELLVVAAPGSQLVPTASAAAYGVLAIADPYPGPITMLVAPSQHGGA
ncbi:hypothetical protein ACF1AJ_04590 [Leifsonia sp. NPDC014704]|uniref:hypothetical protein n=1 Tax=Leifsonia sp. NPDC014704 TaxID=3364123 RepID=UPI0036F45E8C